MHYPVNTLDNKKLLLKLRLLRILDNIFGSQMLWLMIGLVIGFSATFYSVIDAIAHLDKIMVCK